MLESSDLWELVQRSDTQELGSLGCLRAPAAELHNVPPLRTGGCLTRYSFVPCLTTLTKVHDLNEFLVRIP